MPYPSKKIDKIVQTCADNENCSKQEIVTRAVLKYANKDIASAPIEAKPESKKVKRKFNPIKDVSIHVHEEPKPAPTPEKKDHKWDNLPRNTNFGECKDCKVKGKRTKLHKKFKQCESCEANTLTKEDEFCPYCNKPKPEDGWEDGIDLSDFEGDDEDE